MSTRATRTATVHVTDSWLTGSQYDLSASAERAIKRMAQLCQFAFAIEDKAAPRRAG